MKKLKTQTITKKEIADRIAEELKIKQVVSKQIIQSFIDNVTSELVKGNKIELRDFGVFKTTLKKSRVGRNPKSGEVVQVPEKRIVKFKPGKLMREKVQQLDDDSDG